MYGETGTTAADHSRRRFSFGTFCPEVSAGDEIPQGKLGRVQLVHQPLSDGRNAKGRNEERKDEEHDSAHRLPADEQDQGEQRQHDAAQLTYGGRHAEQKCDHSGQQAPPSRGAARILRTIIAATSIKISGWFVLPPILYRWENRHTRMSSFHRFGTRRHKLRYATLGQNVPKSARSVAPPLPTKSCDFVGYPIIPEVVKAGERRKAAPRQVIGSPPLTAFSAARTAAPKGRHRMMPQRKAPAVFQHDGLDDLIALVFVHKPSSP